MLRYLTAALVGLAGGLAPAAEAGGKRLLEGAAVGAPVIQSIDVIAFGPQGTLLIGDGRGAQVVAVDTGDTRPAPWKAKAIERLDEKVAGRLGTPAKNIEFTHLAVNRDSGKAYVAVRRLDTRKSLILTIDGEGKVGELALDGVRHLCFALPRGKGAITKVTDVAWAGDRILAGAVASEEFGCKVYSIPVPLNAKGNAGVFSTETYHVSHRRWETRAPMSTLMPLEIKGKKYVVGAFACTPLVRYPLEDIKPGAKVKGESIVELGAGNQPLNMFAYEKGGKSYVLMNTFRFHHKRAPVGPSPYWAVRVDLDLFNDGAPTNEKAVLRLNGRGQPATEAIRVVEAYHGVVHLDRLDATRALGIKQDGKAGWVLTALDLP